MFYAEIRIIIQSYFLFILYRSPACFCKFLKGHLICLRRLAVTFDSSEDVFRLNIWRILTRSNKSVSSLYILSSV